MLLKEREGISSVLVLKELGILLQDDISLYGDVGAKNELLLKYGRDCIHQVSADCDGKELSLQPDGAAVLRREELVELPV